jgi:hypothetical protein
MMRLLIVAAVLFISHFSLGVSAVSPEVSTWRVKTEDEDFKYWRKLLDTMENMSVPTAAPVPSEPPAPLTPSPMAPTTAPIPSPTQPPTTPPPVPVDVNDACSPSNFQALEDAKKQWDDSGIISYRYVFDQICFCFPSGPLEIEVANCTVDSATFLTEGSEDGIDRASTIEQLFAGLEQSLAGCPDNGPASYQVSFNPELGYPANVNIDRDIAVQDEELVYSVPEFSEVARSPVGCSGL